MSIGELGSGGGRVRRAVEEGELGLAEGFGFGEGGGGGNARGGRRRRGPVAVEGLH